MHSDLRRDFREITKGTAKTFGILGVLTVLLNLALLGGAVWVVVWVLRATGVIA